MSTVTALASWFGSNRSLAENVGKALSGLEWVGVVFGGGLCELKYIKARTINVNDLHSHVINLAEIVSHPTLGPKLYRMVRRAAFHPAKLKCSQQACVAMAMSADQDQKIEWAAAYFVVAWMTRHATSGTPSEFTGGTSVRWVASGGDSNKHYRGAVSALHDWMTVLRGVNFTVMDFRAFLDKCKDAKGHGIYCDPPFPGPGDGYTHTLSEFDHRQLADLLGTFTKTRVVCRFYDHPLVRELYAESRWTWNRLTGGKKQTNEEAPEVLLVNRTA